MSLPAIPPPHCWSCGHSLTMPGAFCDRCGQAQGVRPAPPATPWAPVVQVLPAPKNPAVAVLLSLLFLGSGHLYLGNIGLGLSFVAWHFFLVALLFVPLVDIVAVIVWFLSLGVAMTTAGISAGHKQRRAAPRS